MNPSVAGADVNQYPLTFFNSLVLDLIRYSQSQKRLWFLIFLKNMYRGI